MHLQSFQAFDVIALVDALLLVSWANGAPVAGHLLLADRWACPVDGGALFYDGRPWLGASKTWRGWGISLVTTPLIAVFLGLPWELGAMAALGAMLGDALASFVKRRLGYRSSEGALMLDQIPESVIPALMLQVPLDLSLIDLALVVGGFFVIDLSLTPVARWLGRLGRRLH